MKRKLKNSQHVAELRQQARQMSRHAWTLLRMADEVAQDGIEQNGATGAFSSDPLAYEYEQLLAAMAERLIRERTRRRELFPAPIFGDCGWDMVLILYRNRVHGRRSLLHNIANELGCPVDEVEALAEVLIEEQLAERCDRNQFMRLSESGASRVREFFIEPEPASEVGNDTLLDRKCA